MSTSSSAGLSRPETDPRVHSTSVRLTGRARLSQATSRFLRDVALSGEPRGSRKQEGRAEKGRVLESGERQGGSDRDNV